MSDLPERPRPLPEVIDAQVRLTPAPAEPPAVAEEEDERPVRPPRRQLSGPELIEEGTRFAVGAVVMLGRGLRTMLETYAAAERDQDASRPTEADAPGYERPETITAALPTALFGLAIQTQRRAVDALLDARERLGPGVGWFLDRSFVSPSYERARTRILEWYDFGVAERSVSTDHASAVIGGLTDEGLGFVYENLDLNTITAGFDVSPLIANLDFNNIIVHSTGGIATEARDMVRGQGVTADAIIERIASKVLRRKPSAPGPPGAYGMQANREDDDHSLPALEDEG